MVFGAILLLLLSTEAARAQLPPALVVPSGPRATAYLGIAGFGTGMGAMGHAFVVLAPKPGQLLGSVAYQYNLIVERPPGNVAELVRTLTSSRFAVSRDEGLGFVHRYTAEERPVTLYELKLSEGELARFRAALEAEWKERAEHPRYDYDVFANNCLTALLGLLNGIVAPERRFEGQGGFLASLDLADNAPLVFATRADGHPLFGEGRIELDPAAFKRVRAQVAIDQDLEALGRACGWSEAKSDALRRAARDLELLARPAMGRFFERMADDCASEEAASLADGLRALRESVLPHPAF